jgi:hypothetical protein
MATLSMKRPAYAGAKFITAFADRAMGMWMDQVTYGLQASDKYITTAEVLALNATAVNVVPAPGAGKYLMFMGAIVFLDYNSAAYADDAGEDLVFKYTDKDGASISHTLDGSLFDGTADAVVYAYPLNAAASVLEAAVNAPICICLESGEWLTGDSPLKVRTFYRTITLADLVNISA